MPELLDRLKTALADRYAVQEEIGAGGMATVYLAEDLKHKRKVAVKVLRPELAATLGPERFVREIEIAANLTHPHILMLIDSGEADGFLYYVMPYIEGESLRERLDREGKLSVDEGIRLTHHRRSVVNYEDCGRMRIPVLAAAGGHLVRHRPLPGSRRFYANAHITVDTVLIRSPKN